MGAAGRPSRLSPHGDDQSRPRPRRRTGSAGSALPPGVAAAVGTVVRERLHGQFAEHGTIHQYQCATFGLGHVRLSRGRYERDGDDTYVCLDSGAWCARISAAGRPTAGRPDVLDTGERQSASYAAHNCRPGPCLRAYRPVRGRASPSNVGVQHRRPSAGHPVSTVSGGRAAAAADLDWPVRWSPVRGATGYSCASGRHQAVRTCSTGPLVVGGGSRPTCRSTIAYGRLPRWSTALALDRVRLCCHAAWAGPWRPGGLAPLDRRRARDGVAPMSRPQLPSPGWCDSRGGGRKTAFCTDYAVG